MERIRRVALIAALALVAAAAGNVAAAVPGTAPATDTASLTDTAPAAGTASAAAANAPALDEVDVFGEQPGPGLWKVTKGAHVLWLLGTLDHVPRRMQWRSRAVEAALDGSQELLTGGPAVSAHAGPIMLLRLYLQWRGLQKDPGGTRLSDWLPPPLYARFEALKARYDPRDARIERLRPPFAALRLYRRALAAADLTRGDEIEAAVIELARRRRIPIERARLKVGDPLGTLKQVRALSPAQEVDCLATTVARLETDLPLMQQRARAWATGDIARLRALPFPDQRQACIAELSAAPAVRALVDEAANAWISAAEAALTSHAVSFALQPMRQLLAPDGPLAHFHAEGYQVDSPQ
jgi:uncharacterized protein YbaP (TraB family)